MRERDLVGRRDLFIAEGEVVLAHLVRSGRFGLDSVLIAAKRLEKLTPLLARAPAQTPVYLAAQPVLDRLAGFPIHRGVLGLGRRPPALSLPAALAGLPPRALVVVASGVANHDNLGGVFRNAAAFGVALVVLDAACCDPLYRKAIRVSVGAVLTTSFAVASDVEAAIDALQTTGFTVVALSPRGEHLLNSLPRPPRLAIVLGSEGEGLSEQVLKRALAARIEMAPGVDSLNLAASSAVALHHFARRTCESSS